MTKYDSEIFGVLLSQVGGGRLGPHTRSPPALHRRRADKSLIALESDSLMSRRMNRYEPIEVKQKIESKASVENDTDFALI